jgi:hypothetical protein
LGVRSHPFRVLCCLQLQQQRYVADSYSSAAPLHCIDIEQISRLPNKAQEQERERERETKREGERGAGGEKGRKPDSRNLGKHHGKTYNFAGGRSESKSMNDVDQRTDGAVALTINKPVIERMPKVQDFHWDNSMYIYRLNTTHHTRFQTGFE